MWYTSWNIVGSERVKKGSSKKISYERRAYESVDDKSLS